jgi:prepilin peptidase CpaA
LLVTGWELAIVLAESSKCVLIVALVWVVISDLLYRRISNKLVLGLLALWLLGLVWRAWCGDTTIWSTSLLCGVLTALAVLLVGLGLFVVRWVGAGDVKLMAVLSLWFGDQGLNFLLVTSMVGGVLALALPLLRVFELWLARAALGCSQALALCWPRLLMPLPLVLGGSSPQGIPYGLAIAAGAACMLYLG